jgi:hypothetical protein
LLKDGATIYISPFLDGGWAKEKELGIKYVEREYNMIYPVLCISYYWTITK